MARPQLNLGAQTFSHPKVPCKSTVIIVDTESETTTVTTTTTFEVK